MARIPDADIERLKQKVSLERLVQVQGIELKRLWNWDTNCNEATDSACKADRDRFRNAVEHLKTAAGRYTKGSDERKQLDAILKRIGKENDANRLNVAFDSNMADTGLTVPSGLNIKMTLNFSGLDKAVGQTDDITRLTADAGLVGHEATHAQEGSGFFGMFRRLAGRFPTVQSLTLKQITYPSGRNYGFSPA